MLLLNTEIIVISSDAVEVPRAEFYSAVCIYKGTHDATKSIRRKTNSLNAGKG
jgi:hypothetical protein